MHCASSIIFLLHIICATKASNLTLTFGVLSYRFPQSAYQYLHNRSTLNENMAVLTQTMQHSHLVMLHPNVKVQFKFFDSPFNISFLKQSNTLSGAFISGNLL